VPDSLDYRVDEAVELSGLVRKNEVKQFWLTLIVAGDQHN